MRTIKSLEHHSDSSKDNHGRRANDLEGTSTVTGGLTRGIGRVRTSCASTGRDGSGRGGSGRGGSGGNRGGSGSGRDGVNSLDGEVGRVRLEGHSFDVDGVNVAGGQVSGEGDGGRLALQAVELANGWDSGDTNLIGTANARVEDNVEITSVLGFADIGPADGLGLAGSPNSGRDGLGVVETTRVSTRGLGSDNGDGGKSEDGRVLHCVGFRWGGDRVFGRERVEVRLWYNVRLKLSG